MGKARADAAILAPDLMLRTHLRIRALLIAGFACASLTLTGLVASQPRPPQSQPQPTFRTGVEAVVLDVSVLDKDRRPVRGLTAADFTILEDGKPQEVRTFKAIDMEDVVAAPATPWASAVTSDVRKNDEFKDHRVVVIVMDSSTPMPAADVMLAKRMGRMAVDNLAPDDLAAVVYTLGMSNGQEFTKDRARLRAAVDKFNGTPDNTWVMDGRGNARAIPFNQFNQMTPTLLMSTISTLKGITEQLTVLPERRKALILVSVGLPIDASFLAEAHIPGDFNADSQGQIGMLLRELLKAFEAAQRANVSIYGVDPGGLRTIGSPLNHAFLRTVSETTGGFVVLDTNDPAPGIAQIYRENASYYLLGYQPTNARAEGKLRKIDVRVDRPGVTVRARNGYIEPRATKPAASAGTGTATTTTESPLTSAMLGILPTAGISLQMTAASFAKTGSNEAEVAIVLEGRKPVPEGITASTDDIDVLVRAYDMQAKLHASEQLKVRLTAYPGRGEDMRYAMLSRLTLKPGRYQLRLVARSSASGKSGSVYYDLDVPDFSKPALSVSDVMLDVEPPVLTAPRGKLAPLVPIVPTAQRDFATDEQASAFMRVYQGGKGPILPIVVTTRIVDGQNKAVFSKEETLTADRFTAGRAADYRLQLPIANLAKGPHLLSIVATRGRATAQRDVPFSVR